LLDHCCLFGCDFRRRARVSNPAVSVGQKGDGEVGSGLTRYF
jgi:hypothetical protein